MRIRPWSIPIGTISLLGIISVVAFLLSHFVQPSIEEKDESSPAKWLATSEENNSAIAQPSTVKDKVYQRVNPAVVTIYGAEGLGSGMILRPNGLILTNKHLVKNSANVVAKTATGETYDGKVIDFDLQYDLALVKLNSPGLSLPTVTLASKTILEKGTPVYAIGSPAGKAGTITEGTFTRLTEHGSLQTSSGLLNSGNSGGPLLNAEGEVIGVNKGLLSDRSGLATGLSAAKALIKRYDQVNKPDTSFNSN